MWLNKIDRPSQFSGLMIEALTKILDQAGYRFNQTQNTNFCHYFELLSHWNKRINLTSIDEDKYLTHHLLDSLSVSADLHGDTVLDMGTGGGLPGVILAITNPEKQFTLLDARNKKIAFLHEVKTALPLCNIKPVHSRVEKYRPSIKYRTVVARAFAQIDTIYRLARPVLAPQGRIIAMKGRLTDQEIAQLDHIAVHYEVKSVEVHGLHAQRHIVTIYED